MLEFSALIPFFLPFSFPPYFPFETVNRLLFIGAQMEMVLFREASSRWFRFCFGKAGLTKGLVRWRSLIEVHDLMVFSFIYVWWWSLPIAFSVSFLHFTTCVCIDVVWLLCVWFWFMMWKGWKTSTSERKRRVSCTRWNRIQVNWNAKIIQKRFMKCKVMHLNSFLQSRKHLFPFLHSIIPEIQTPWTPCIKGKRGLVLKRTNTASYYTPLTFPRHMDMLIMVIRQNSSSSLSSASINTNLVPSAAVCQICSVQS